MTRIQKLLVALAVGALGGWAPAAQDRLNPPAPLGRGESGPSIGAEAMALAAAQRAQDLGFPGLAADLYRQAREMPGGDRVRISLALATALLDANRPQEAEKILGEIREPRGSAWHLRAGLAAAQLRQLDGARAGLAAVREAELSADDLPWYWFLQGELVDLAKTGEVSRANEFYRRAEEAARTELGRARFQLAAETLRLRLGSTSEADRKVMRENYERYQGKPLGYGFAQTYAVALDASGQKGEAITFLQGVLVGLPRREQRAWDNLRLVLGLIGDKSRAGTGRNALSQLLESGSDPLRQRQALQILAAESGAEPERGHLRTLLAKLLGQQPDHPIKESLLFFRAQLALLEANYSVAEEDANTLLRQYPLSPLRAHAFGVLTQSAWEQRRYRQAASNAQKTRAELRGAAGAPTPAPESASRSVQAMLGVLEAEAWFRAGLAAGDRSDFRSAADAYAAVVRERSAELGAKRLGGLMYQRVLAEIKSGSNAGAKVIDELEPDPAFDLESRWQAEWSLARALQLQGDAGIKEADARVTKLLRTEAGGASGLKPELRARMAWLQTRLSFDSGDPARTIELVQGLLARPLEIDAALKTEIVSTAVLLRARAEFALGREAAALETLKQLRSDNPTSDAAASSYLIESEHYAELEKIDEARNRLISLTDNPAYKGNEYVPFALFRLASLAERLGRPENLQEANKRIEELVASPTSAGHTDLIFAARLKQGNIFRKLNDFAAAQRAYEDLVNRYPRRPDVVLAQLALAETHTAQSAPRGDGSTTDAMHADSAQLIFEQLRDRVDAPRDVRVEAGYNLGLLLARRGKSEEAVLAWGRDVVVPFLKEEKKPFEPDAKRPYWLARTLRDLGELLEKLGRLDEAKEAYQLILDKGLPFGDAVARARLGQLGVNPPKR